MREQTVLKKRWQAILLAYSRCVWLLWRLGLCIFSLILNKLEYSSYQGISLPFTLCLLPTGSEPGRGAETEGRSYLILLIHAETSEDKLIITRKKTNNCPVGGVGDVSLLSQVVIWGKVARKWVEGRMNSSPCQNIQKHPQLSLPGALLAVCLRSALPTFHVPWGACPAASIQECSCSASDYRMLLQKLFLIPPLPEPRVTPAWPATKHLNASVRKW